jgi:hypothetical protein
MTERPLALKMQLLELSLARGDHCPERGQGSHAAAEPLVALKVPEGQGSQGPPAGP